MSAYRFRNWFGPYYRGAMRDRRSIKRAEAEQRNAAAQPVAGYSCGHVHSRDQGRLCARLVGAA